MLLKHDISQYHALKSTFEQILGQEAWLDLKECTSLATWKKYTRHLLSAMLVSAKASIEIWDDSWMAELEELIEQGKSAIKSTKSIDEVLATLSATLTKIVFLQLGCVPNRKRAKKVSLAYNHWKLNRYRSVQYVQNKSQLEALRWNAQQRVIGFEKQMELKEQHRTSGSRLSFFEWCKEYKDASDH